MFRIQYTGDDPTYQDYFEPVNIKSYEFIDELAIKHFQPTDWKDITVCYYDVYGTLQWAGTMGQYIYNFEDDLIDLRELTKYNFKRFQDEYQLLNNDSKTEDVMKQLQVYGVEFFKLEGITSENICTKVSNIPVFCSTHFHPITDYEINLFKTQTDVNNKGMRSFEALYGRKRK